MDIKLIAGLITLAVAIYSLMQMEKHIKAWNHGGATAWALIFCVAIIA